MTNPRMLPSDRSERTMHVKLSQTITLVCICGYSGFARMVTGRSASPIYTCPECRRVAQNVKGIKP